MKKNIISFGASLILFFVGAGPLYGLYLEPILFDDIALIHADPYYGMALILGAAIGFFMLAPVNVGRRIMKGSELHIMTTAKISLCFGILCVGLNAFLYHGVIYPDGYKLCPPQMGYRSNLMRDYALDLDMCRK